MDFVADALLDGRRVRALTVVDNFTRHCQIIEVDARLTGTRVVQALDGVSKREGYPKMMTVENAVIESFNGLFRDECLNAHVFVSLYDARRKIERWRIDDNECRPHGSLGNPTPVGFAKKGAEKASQKCKISNHGWLSFRGRVKARKVSHTQWSNIGGKSINVHNYMHAGTVTGGRSEW